MHLPRLIDKARLHRKGLLDGYNYKTVGFDKHLLAFLKIDGNAFEEIANKLEDDAAILKWVQENGAKHSPEAIEQWDQAMISRHPDTAAKKATGSLDGNRFGWCPGIMEIHTPTALSPTRAAAIGVRKPANNKIPVATASEPVIHVPIPGSGLPVSSNPP